VRLGRGEVHQYGFGWYVFGGDRSTILHHRGGLWSFRSLYLFGIQSGLSVAILANYREANVAALMSGVLALLAPDIGAAWTTAISVQQPAASAGVNHPLEQTPWSNY
jgi:hypothetical protein